MKQKIYDAIVVGAGVAGCSIAYALKQKGLEVLIVDKATSAASGGSGAAGAFVSPKIGKASPLQTLTNEAFAFALTFYKNHFPEHFHQTGVIRIPKDAQDNKKFSSYRAYNIQNFEDMSAYEIKAFGINSEFGGFLFNEAGVCDAKELCQSLIEDIKFASIYVDTIKQKSDKWILNNRVASKYLILATGYQDNLIDIRYMGIKGVWGSRGDFKSTLPISKSMHKDLSISKNMHGIIKIGATHKKGERICLDCHNQPLKELLHKASVLIDTSKLELVEVFCGMRSGSKDYLPLVGGVVDVEYMFDNYPKITRGAKVPLKMIENLFILNGLGGRGFVFAPLMAQQLAEHIVEGKAIDSRIDPNRLFWKWVRRL
ncbi:MAG: FAD-dependent oxidoreductase [Campylobacterales bacterium]|nr:FAD-dependent oxidoreductase [Campylobacterales bacterium]